MNQSSGEAFPDNQSARPTRRQQKSEPTEPISRDDVVPTVSTTGRDECYSALAQVNLLRVRKQFDQAVILCESVIQRWSLRADAHALLGDLYQDQGRHDDALLRYCRVLELDPTNKLNRKKMADIVRYKRQQLGPLSVAAKVSVLRSDRLVRTVILAFATLMLITIMVAPMVLQKRQQEALAASSGTTVDRRINLEPIILQPSPPQPISGDEPQPSRATPAMIRDPVEQALVDLMSNDKTLLQQGIQVLDAQEDPLDDRFSITFLDRPDSSDSDTRSSILQNCLRVAQSASMRFGSRDVKEFTIRCLLLSSPMASGGSIPNIPIEATTTLVFTGDILRNALPGNEVRLDTQTAQQLQPYFTNVWWGTGQE
jgi:hypothetical protein